MKIKDGGVISKLQKKDGPTKIETIRIEASSERKVRTFGLWINEDSLSYLTLDEMLDLRDEINAALKKVLN